MKLKSLFLASLAAMAMVSCSNENDPIENGDTAKNAIFNFSIALPNAPGTRAATDPGTATEQNVNKITLVLNYEGTANIPAFTKVYTNIASEFVKVENVYTLITPVMVSPGTAKATIYVNDDGVPTAPIETNTTAGLGKYASIEGDGNFFMSGETNEAFPITAKKENIAPPVKVDRVAVKLDEITDTNAEEEGKQCVFTASASNLTDATNLTITLTNYAYSNLNKKSNSLASAGKYYNADDFLNPFVEDLEEDNWDKTLATNNMSHDVTYCFENGITTPTKIYYKATATVEGVVEGTNFYVYKETLYKDYAALNTVFNGSLESAHGLTDESSNSDFMTKIGAKKYTGGVCYYSAAIDASGITRNNWYKLKVTGIKDLGLPEIDNPIPGDPTLLIFSVEVNPWNVSTVEIPL